MAIGKRSKNTASTFSLADIVALAPDNTLAYDMLGRLMFIGFDVGKAGKLNEHAELMKNEVGGKVLVGYTIGFLDGWLSVEKFLPRFIVVLAPASCRVVLEVMGAVKGRKTEIFKTTDANSLLIRFHPFGTADVSNQSTFGDETC